VADSFVKFLRDLPDGFLYIALLPSTKVRIMSSSSLLTSEIEDRYNAHLRELGDEAVQLQQWLLDQERERGVVFGGRPVPTLARPVFVSASQDRMVKEACNCVMICIEKILERYFHNPQIQAMVGLPEAEDRLARIDPRIQPRVPNVRLDAFLQGDDLKFLEFNAESPAAVAFTDVQQSIFDGLPTMEALHKDFELAPANLMPRFFDSFTAAYRSFGLDEDLRMAVVDWRDVPTRTEFPVVCDYFERRGVPSVVVDPRDLVYRDGALWAGDFRVNCIYRRVILSELVARIDDVGDLVRAVQDHAVCVINPFCSKVPGSKSFLAVLSDERFDSWFTDEENALIRKYVPWTRMLPDRETLFEGVIVDAHELASREQDRFVIKPVSGYGGKDVHLGRETDRETWLQVLAASERGGWVVQEYVDIPEEEFPLCDPALRFVSRKTNLNPYAFGGRYAGSMVRLSKSSIINVSAGGGQVPVYAVAGRK